MPPTWIDTHCHLDAPEFAHDVDTVRAQARAAGVQHIVLPAVQVAHADAVRSLAHRHGDSYALGIHPLYTPQAADDDVEKLAQVLEQHRNDPHLVAIGEIGLDFFVPRLDAERQTRFFRQQLQLARRFDLPVIASGGVGDLDHLADGIQIGGADAVLAASIFHYGEYTVEQAKRHMRERGIPVRL